MKPSRPGVLVLTVLVPALVVWLLVREVYTGLPKLPLTAIPTFLLLGLGEIVSGIGIRNRIHHKAAAEKARPVDPMSVARMAALGKASAHAAAALAGVFLGFVLYTAENLDKATPRQDFTVSVATTVSALILVGAALFLEYCCRVPKDPEDADRR